MDIYLLLKSIHILGAAVLFGTGMGIAFFMFMADRSGDVATIAATARLVVVADYLFTAPAVLIQPVTGFALIDIQGYAIDEPWLAASIVLYLMIGVCWLPVVWLQIRMRDAAQQAVKDGTPLPPEYRRWMRRWFILGWPAFLGVVLIVWLMVAKPPLA